MACRLRRFVLTAHVVSSVGWLGAVVVFLALAAIAVTSQIGMTSQDARMVRAIFLVMAPAAWSVLVPLAFASLLTGLVQSLGTAWGLFRHYWVVIKLAITVIATIVLLSYAQTLSYLAGVAADPSLSDYDLLMLPTSGTLQHASGGLLLLLVATVLSVYKPRGMTRYGQRQQRARQRERRAGAKGVASHQPSFPYSLVRSR